MKKPSYHRVLREEFVKARYERFLKKKAFLESCLPEEAYTLTDLDQSDPECGKQIKDMVLCDFCNEDILEPTFVMFCASSVYHEACAKKDPGFSLPPEAPAVSYENVISLFIEDSD